MKGRRGGRGRDIGTFSPGSWLEPGLETLLSRFEERTGTKGHFRGHREGACKNDLLSRFHPRTGTKGLLEIKFSGAKVFLFEKSNKFINSISFDLFIRKMQLKYQIVHKNIIYLFIINSFLFEI